MADRDPLYTIPNALSVLRILLAPVLLYLALTGRPTLYIGVLLVAEFTDVLDGFLARLLDQISDLGSHLDSVGDFINYATMAMCAWLLWPDILQRELPWFLAVVLSFILPAAFGFMRYRRFTGYHTWSVKITVACCFVSYILLFTGLADWPFRVAATMAVFAALEEMAITALSREEHVDVRSFWHAWKTTRQQDRG